MMNKPIGGIFNNGVFTNLNQLNRSTAFSLPSMRSVELAISESRERINSIPYFTNFAQSEFENSEINNLKQAKPKLIKVKVLRYSKDFDQQLEPETSPIKSQLSPKQDHEGFPNSMVIESYEEEKSPSENQFGNQNIKNINQINKEIEFCLNKRSTIKKEGIKKLNESVLTVNNEITSEENKKNHAILISSAEDSVINNTDSLATRCDVIYKTILRDFRRHYQNKFLETSDFSKRNKQEPNDMKVAECVKSLIYPKEGTMLHNCLYKFSIQKAMILIKNRYIFKLFEEYYQKIELGEIEMTATMLKNREAYLNGFHTLIYEGSK